jgi:hypothetical protein
MCPHCIMAFLMGLAGIGPIFVWARAKLRVWRTWRAWRAQTPKTLEALGSDRYE